MSVAMEMYRRSTAGWPDDVYPGFEHIGILQWVVDFTKPLAGLEDILNCSVSPSKQSIVWAAFDAYIAPSFLYRIRTSEAWQERLTKHPGLNDYVSLAYQHGYSTSMYWVWSKQLSEVNCERCGSLVIPIGPNDYGHWVLEPHACESRLNSITQVESGFRQLPAAVSVESYVEPFTHSTVVEGDHKLYWVPDWWYKKYDQLMHSTLRGEMIHDLLGDLAIAHSAKDEQAEALALLAIDLSLE